MCLIGDAKAKVGSEATFKERLTRVGAKSGDVQVSLIWHNVNDLDLHVVTPSGEHIFFSVRSANRRWALFGQLGGLGRWGRGAGGGEVALPGVGEEAREVGLRGSG